MTARTFVIGGALVAALVVAAVLTWASWASESTVNRTTSLAKQTAALTAEINTRQIAARLAVCQHDVADAKQHRAAAQGQWKFVLDAVLANPDRATSAAAIEAFQARLDGLIDTEYPLRDCSPAGIAKFYAPTTTTTKGS